MTPEENRIVGEAAKSKAPGARRSGRFTVRTVKGVGFSHAPQTSRIEAA